MVTQIKQISHLCPLSTAALISAKLILILRILIDECVIMYYNKESLKRFHRVKCRKHLANSKIFVYIINITYV